VFLGWVNFIFPTPPPPTAEVVKFLFFYFLFFYFLMAAGWMIARRLRLAGRILYPRVLENAAEDLKRREAF
jgi:hypothetical protein